MERVIWLSLTVSPIANLLQMCNKCSHTDEIE